MFVCMYVSVSCDNELEDRQSCVWVSPKMRGFLWRAVHLGHICFISDVGTQQLVKD